MKLKGSPHYWMMTGKKPNYIKEGVKTYGTVLSSAVNFFQYAGHSTERKKRIRRRHLTILIQRESAVIQNPTEIESVLFPFSLFTAQSTV